MRHTIYRLTTAALIAGAALSVSACGEKKSPAPANTVEAGAEEPALEGSVNDVTAVDAAGASDNVIMETPAPAVDNAGSASETPANAN